MHSLFHSTKMKQIYLAKRDDDNSYLQQVTVTVQFRNEYTARKT